MSKPLDIVLKGSEEKRSPTVLLTLLSIEVAFFSEATYSDTASL